MFFAARNPEGLVEVFEVGEDGLDGGFHWWCSGYRGKCEGLYRNSEERFVTIVCQDFWSLGKKQQIYSIPHFLGSVYSYYRKYLGGQVI